MVGAGPAGLAVALMLAKKGWAVSVFERSRDPAAFDPGGGLLMMVKNVKHVAVYVGIHANNLWGYIRDMMCFFGGVSESGVYAIPQHCDQKVREVTDILEGYVVPDM